MKKSARPFQPKGFTLIEFILFAAIFGLLLGWASPYLFGTKEKASLELERDKIVSALKIAQQKAIEAHKGYEYGLRFETEKQYTPISVHPTTGAEQAVEKTVTLPPQIKISPFSPVIIKFQRLTGKSYSPLDLTLTSKKFKVEINVSEAGMITSTNPERI